MARRCVRETIYYAHSTAPDDRFDHWRRDHGPPQLERIVLRRRYTAPASPLPFPRPMPELIDSESMRDPLPASMPMPRASRAPLTSSTSSAWPPSPPRRASLPGAHSSFSRRASHCISCDTVSGAGRRSSSAASTSRSCSPPPHYLQRTQNSRNGHCDSRAARDSSYQNDYHHHKSHESQHSSSRSRSSSHHSSSSSHAHAHHSKTHKDKAWKSDLEIGATFAVLGFSFVATCLGAAPFIKPREIRNEKIPGSRRDSIASPSEVSPPASPSSLLPAIDGVSHADTRAVALRQSELPLEHRPEPSRFHHRGEIAA